MGQTASLLAELEQQGRKNAALASEHDAADHAGVRPGNAGYKPYGNPGAKIPCWSKAQSPGPAPAPSFSRRRRRARR